MWHYVGHSFCWCMCAPVRESLCLLWRETHTKGLSTRFPTRPVVDERMKVLEKTERVSWQRKAEENCRLGIAIKRRIQSTEGGSEKMEAGQRRQSRDESTFLVPLWKFRANIRCNSLQMHGELHKSVSHTHTHTHTHANTHTHTHTHIYIYIYIYIYI